MVTHLPWDRIRTKKSPTKQTEVIPEIQLTNSQTVSSMLPGAGF